MSFKQITFLLQHFKENNRAGLIGQSTLQPLQTIQHVIECYNKQDSNNKNYRLWIGLQDISIKAYDWVNISLLHLAFKTVTHTFRYLFCYYKTLH